MNVFRSCCVCGRNNSLVKNLQFRKFPKTNDLRDRWTEIIADGLKIPEWSPPPNAIVCHFHFINKDDSVPTKVTRFRRKVPDFSLLNAIESDASLSTAQADLIKTINDKQTILYNIQVGFNDCKIFRGLQTLEELTDLTGLRLPQFRACLKKFMHGSDDIAQNQLLLFLVKLKTGLSDAALGNWFRVPPSIVRDNFLWITQEICSKSDEYITLKRHNQAVEPIQKSYPNTRVILSFLEVPLHMPEFSEDRECMMSERKLTYTTKYLIGFDTLGKVSLVSKGYGGKATDMFLVQDNASLRLFLKGNDLILMAKNSIKEAKGVILPEKQSPQLKEFIRSAVTRLKVFSILKNITKDLEVHLDGIVEACCVIANVQSTEISE